MASVTDEVVCPKCKGMAQIEVYYRRGTHHLFCETCGFSEEGDGHEVRTRGGHGAYRLEYRGCAGLGAFRTRKPARKRFTPQFNAKR